MLLQRVLNDKMHNPEQPVVHQPTAGEGIGNYLLDKFFSQADWVPRAYLVRLFDASREVHHRDLQRPDRWPADLLFEGQLADIASGAARPPRPTIPPLRRRFVHLDRSRTTSRAPDLPPQLLEDHRGLHRPQPDEDHRDHVQPDRREDGSSRAVEHTGKSISIDGWSGGGLGPPPPRDPSHVPVPRRDHGGRRRGDHAPEPRAFKTIYGDPDGCSAVPRKPDNLGESLASNSRARLPGHLDMSTTGPKPGSPSPTAWLSLESSTWRRPRQAN